MNQFLTEEQLNKHREEIARFLRDTRIEKELTQQELADITGITKRTISRIENAHFWPVMKQIVIICAALDVEEIPI